MVIYLPLTEILMTIIEKRIYTEEERARASEDVSNMTLFSDAMTVAYRDKTYTAYSLESLLGMKVSDSMKDEMVVHAENWLKRLENRDACLDVVIEFPSERIHIEIQQLKRKDGIPRSMFYLGMLLSDIRKGKKRIDPYHVISIWICDYNPISGAEELPFYTFENTYRKRENMVGIDSPFELDDGVTMIFVNASYDWEPLKRMRELTREEKALMEYLKDMKRSDVSEIVHKEAFDVLSLYKEGGPMYGEVHEEFMEYHKEEAEKLLAKGKAEGIDAEKLATARRMLASNFDIDTISAMTMLTKEEIQDLK